MRILNLQIAIPNFFDWSKDYFIVAPEQSSWTNAIRKIRFSDWESGIGETILSIDIILKAYLLISNLVTGIMVSQELFPLRGLHSYAGQFVQQ